MRILWIVNIVMPELAEHLGIPVAASGSWLIDIADGLAKTDNKIAIACVYGDTFKKIELNNKVYYLLPGSGKNLLFYTKKYEEIWKSIVKDCTPDVIHIHGTEYSHGLACMRAVENVPYIISIQGMLNRIKDVDFGEIPIHYFLVGRSLRQWLHFNGELEMHILNKKNAKLEKEMFERAYAINGVSTWDTSIACSFNPNLKVYKLDYNLRESYYHSRKWSISESQNYTIFTNPGNMPLKGLHMLIKAAALLIDKFPQLEIRVPGMAGEKGNVKVTGAYSKYLHKLITDLKMEKHIVFLGKQTEQQMVENTLSARVTVIPSAIEGASLILHEAMFLGAPCIATFRGGMADFVTDKVDGFLYDYPEYTYLAERIEQVFLNDDLCGYLSENAIKKASSAHERKRNVDSYVDMYKEIIEG